MDILGGFWDDAGTAFFFVSLDAFQVHTQAF